MAATDWLERNLGLRKRPQVFQQIDGSWSLSDPDLARMLASAGWIGTSTGLPSVSEADALGITAFGRGIELIAGTLAGLPLKAYVKHADDSREEVPSVLDKPQGPYAVTSYQWRELVYLHLVVYREAFLLHVLNGADVLVGLWPIHPMAVTKVEWVGPGKAFHVKQAGGPDKVYSDLEVTHVMGPNSYGLRGVPLYTAYRKVFQTAIAGEIAAGRSFTAPMLSGLVTTAQDEDVTDDEAKVIVADLNDRFGGASKAGQLAFVNRHLEVKPWQQTNADAQFMESREYENEEFARMLGLPPHLLALVEKQTSWGTGVAEQNIGLARYCLMSYSSRLESALTEYVLDGPYAETDYKGLLQGSPADEIKLLLDEVQGGILTTDEARTKLNMDPLPASATPQPENVGAIPNG